MTTAAELNTLLDALEKRAPSREEARLLPRLYRRAVHELADARAQKKPGLGVLEAAVRRAHGLLYAPVHKASAEWTRDLVVTFPRAVRAHLRGIGLAYAVMMLGTVFGYVEIRRNPASADLLLPRELQANADRFRGEADNRAQSNPINTAFYFTNNSKVAFVSFALGLTYGVGTILVLFQNGLILGGTAAVVALTRSERALLSWILPHGGIELTAIAIAATGGLMMAKALISPGFRRRRDALAAAASEALPLALGASMLLIVAGVTEATIAPLPWSLAVKGLLGLVLDVLMVAYLALAGRQKLIASDPLAAISR